MTPLEILKEDILKNGIEIPAEEWNSLLPQFSEESIQKKTDILKQTDICEEVLFITSGIAASEYILDDGKRVISRFFKKNNLCTNIVSVSKKVLAQDNLIAVTDVSAVSISYDVFYSQYMGSGQFGDYLKIKILDNLFEVKNFVSIKTLSNTELKYQFLEEEYPEIIRNVPYKDIANFIGITPEGLSRFLSRRYRKS